MPPGHLVLKIPVMSHSSIANAKCALFLNHPVVFVPNSMTFMKLLLLTFKKFLFSLVETRKT